MDNRETSTGVVFEYTGVGCSVPKDITSVSFNEGLQKIGHGSFRNCTSLESITVPSTVTEIGARAFEGCSNLREVTLNDGLQKIGDKAFYECPSLQSITLPSTVTEIGNWAFAHCNNLREVTLNDGLQRIRKCAFFDCTSLETITLPSTVTEIGFSAFRDCPNLREVKLNEGLQKIGDWAFHDCDTLERFLFPTISYRLENICQTGHWEDLEDKVSEVRGVVQWESDKLFASRATYQNWSEAKRDIGRITRLLSYYELKEATTTFELALWKSKLDQADATNTTNRAAYRIDVPGPVKDTMLQYLANEFDNRGDEEDASSENEESDAESDVFLQLTS